MDKEITIIVNEEIIKTTEKRVNRIFENKCGSCVEDCYWKNCMKNYFERSYKK